MPPKLFEGAHEQDGRGNSIGHLMDERERQANRALASLLVQSFLEGRPGRSLDIGAKYPFLARCLKDLGCDAHALDNLEEVPAYARELGVPMFRADFEAAAQDQVREWTAAGKFRLITLVHVFQHLYDPKAALATLRELLADDGVLFIRLPDHGVPGYERDLTPAHYTIHPFYHCLSSLQRLLEETGGHFTVAWTANLAGAGQRDLALVPAKARIPGKPATATPGPAPRHACMHGITVERVAEAARRLWAEPGA